MPEAQIYCDTDDAREADQFRTDLERIGWTVFRSDIHSDLKIDPNAPGSAMIAWLPDRRDVRSDLLSVVSNPEVNFAHRIVLAPVGEPELLEIFDQRTGSAVQLISAADYDSAFENLFLALHSPRPSWLEGRIRPSQLSRPFGVGWLDDDVIVSDGQNGNVVQIGHHGTTVLFSGLSEPAHVTSDHGQLLVANSSADEIVIASIVDRLTTDIRSFNEPLGSLRHPQAARVARGKVAIADTENNRVLVGDGHLGTNDEIKWNAISGMHRPADIAFVGDDLAVADTLNHRIRCISPDGRILGSIAEYGDVPGQLVHPKGLVAWNDILFVTDERRTDIQVLRIARTAHTMTISHAGVLGSSWIGLPIGLAVTQSGRMAVADRAKRCVWIIDLNAALASEQING